MLQVIHTNQLPYYQLKIYLFPMTGEIQLIVVQKLIRGIRITGDQTFQRHPSELQLVLSVTHAIAVTQFTSRSTPILRIVSRRLGILRLQIG